MINYTTPTIYLTVENVDLSGQKDVYVSLEQFGLELTKSGEDITVSTTTHDQITDTNISVPLTQEESAAFEFGKEVQVQVNWIDSQGVRDATEIKKIKVFRNLLDEVISYGD